MNQQPLRVNMAQTTAFVCNECNNETFKQVFLMRKLSALLSPSGEETMIPIPTFACDKCGHINEEFLPNELE